jgi:hypothetical protein
MPAATLVDPMPGGQAVIHARGTLNIANTAANVKSAGVDLTGVTGARVGMPVLVVPKTETGEQFFWGRVTADDTVQVKLINFTAGAIDPADQDFDVYVFARMPA